MERKDSKKQLKEMLITAGIVMLSLFIVYVLDGFFPFGGGSVAALDLNSQYIPLLYRFYDVVTGTKHFAMDLHLGGGINLYSDTLTEVLNPFNYLLLLFGRANLYKAVNVLVILYAVAASVSANFALNKLADKTGRWIRIALSVSYGMSYYMAYQYEIIRWMYIVVLFPLFFLALKRMLEEEKPFLFIILLSYIFVISLQFGIQLCLFSFVYSTCFILNEKREGKNIKINGHKCLICGLSFVISILLSAFSTFPAVINILNSARSTQNSSIVTVITHHGLDNILERIMEISNPVVFGLIIASILILKKDTIEIIRSRKGLITALAVMLITVILEPSNLLWHLGSYQCFPVRYGYTVVWLGILLAADLINESSKKEKFTDKKSINILLSIICIAAAAAIFVFAYIKRLSFAQAFATLDISGVCKKETILLYLIMLAVAVLSAAEQLFARDRISAIKITFLSALMGVVWFMLVFFPQNSEARWLNEENYRQMNSLYSVDEESEYKGHIREIEGQPLNKALISGEYSMSAYVPSGESKEYVSTMNNLGYETPWISVTSYGGSSLSDRLLGLDGEYTGAIVVSKEEYGDIRTVSDYSELLEEKQPVSMLFDNKKGHVTVQSDGEMTGFILLPMAYVKGWESPQGKVTEHLGGLLAIELDGSCKIAELDYSVPGLMSGFAVSLIGVLLAIGLGFLFVKLPVFDRIAKAVYITATLVFLLFIYILPNIGLLVFMGAKAAGKDIAPYLESVKAEDSSVHTLLNQTVEEDGIHVLIGRNNLMNDKGVKLSSSDDESGYFRASKAADGDNSKDSRWSSVNDWDNCDHYLQADFKTAKNIKAVKIFWERTNPSHYYIELSDDGKNWKAVSEFDKTPETNPQTIYYEDGIQGRFIRLHVTDVAKNEEDASLYYQNVSVNEMEVYDDECDSFVIKTPVLTDGKNRQIPIPEVPEGYVLKIGGINYDNLLIDKKTFADTIDDVEINLGYELYCGYQEWDIKGFDILLPASEKNEGDSFGFSDTSVREWKKEDGKLSFGGREKDIEALKERKDSNLLDVAVKELDYLGDEGYEIRIENDKIGLYANNGRGLYWGRVTLSHMIEENSGSWDCGTIRDYPEYAVRGFVLDAARREIPMEMLYRMLDLLADNYMNTFQIHLSDNAIISMSEYDGTVEGARELPSAFRLESDISEGGENLTSNFHYSNEEFAAFIADAKKVGIDVVPEIDTPAHSLAIAKLYPELAYNDYPELADTLDVSKPEVLDFTTGLWSDYLTGDDALFEDCNVLHLGTDEFYGDDEAYSKYVASLCKSVKAMAEDKDIRIWSSVSYNDMDTASIDKNVQMMIWSAFWADPLEVYNSGFGVINCMSSNLYIIVGSGSDRLNMDNLKEKWEPNLFYDEDVYEEIVEWSPRMLGACYSLWNDNYEHDDEGIYDRFSEPINVISEKLWNRE